MKVRENEMKIVYYFEPWVELERPHLRYHNLRYQMAPQAKQLAKQGHEVLFLIGDGTYQKCILEGYNFDNIDVEVINQDELNEIFPQLSSQVHPSQPLHPFLHQ